MLRNRLITQSLQVVQLVLAAALLIGPASGAFASDDRLGVLENKLFHRIYSVEDVESRLSRLENMVFGQPKTGTSEQRQAALETILFGGASSLPPDFAASQSKPVSEVNREASAPPSSPPDATSYPTITQLEKQVFHQSFEREALPRRLGRLEHRIFGQVHDRLPLVDRVDQLSLKLNPTDTLGVEEGWAQPRRNELPNTAAELTGSNLAVYAHLAGLEEQVLGKSFGGEMIVNRLTRLEKVVFGTPRQGTVDNRMRALTTQVLGSTGTPASPPAMSSYGYYSSPSYGGGHPPPGYSAGPPPPIVPYGLKVSREMMSLLPQNVQTQVLRRGGTIVEPAPDSFSDLSTLESLGSESGYLPAPGQPFPQQQLAQPVDPNRVDLQSVMLMENRVFGRMFPEKPFIARLDSLERELFGRTFPEQPFQQRLDRLVERTLPPG